MKIITTSPALLPAVGLVAGTAAATVFATVPLPAAALLLALALALGRPPGHLLAGFALGLLLGAAGGRPDAELAGWLEAERPVTVLARVDGHPWREDDQTLFFARTVRVRQGRRVATPAVDFLAAMPAGATPPARGSTVRLRGYLRRSAGFANGAGPTRPGPWRLRLKSARLLDVEEPPGLVDAAAGRLRRRVESVLDAAGSGAVGEAAPGLAEQRGLAVVRALVLGDRSHLPDPWRQALRRSGLAHLTAVSGLHVGVVAGLILVAAGPLPARWRLAVAAVGIAGYLLLVGPRPSVLRASLMGLAVIAALLMERPPQALQGLAVGVALLLVEEPSRISDLGFQLSAAATFGILLGSTPVAERLRLLPGWLRPPLAVSLCAQVATLPFTLPLAGGVPLLAPLWNLVAVPWLAVVLVTSFFWLAVAAASAPLGCALLGVLGGLAAPLGGLASLPPATAPALPVTDAELRADPDAAELWMLDVGQGDAVLLRDGDRAVLVDGGGWPAGDLGGRLLLPVLRAAGVGKLRAVALTHPDRDHCGGLRDLVRYLPVDELWMGPGWGEDRCAGELMAAPGTRWRVLWRGERLRLGRWRLEVLHPPPGARRERNDRSLVLRAAVGRRRVLLTGDVEAAAERRLVSRYGADLRSDVLKVAHHGSRTSTSRSFLDAVDPRLALVSAGRSNPYGHPAPEVLDRLAERGVRVLRTDRAGLVRLRFGPDGRLAAHRPGWPRL